MIKLSTSYFLRKEDITTLHLAEVGLNRIPHHLLWGMKLEIVKKKNKCDKLTQVGCKSLLSLGLLWTKFIYAQILPHC